MYRSHVLVCGGTGCTSSNSAAIIEALEKEIEAKGLKDEVKVIKTGCFGLCALGPIMVVYPEGSFYSEVKVENVPEIVEEHLLKGRIVKHLLYDETAQTEDIKSINDTNFYKKQKRVALRNCGVINPEDIDEYIAMDGYQALAKALTEMTPEQVIEVFRGEILGDNAAACQMVERNVEESLNLVGVQVHCQNAVSACCRDQIRDELRRNRIVGFRLAVLSGVAKVRHDGGNSARRCALQCVDQDQKLHQVVIAGRAGRLNDENIRASDRFVNVQTNFAVAEMQHFCVAEGQFQIRSDVLSQLFVAVARNDLCSAKISIHF